MSGDETARKRRQLDYLFQRKDLNRDFMEHIRMKNWKVLQALEKGTFTPDQCPFFYDEIEQYKSHEVYLREACSLFTFGSGDCGPLALGDHRLDASTPAQVNTIPNNGTVLACGGLHSAIVSADNNASMSTYEPKKKISALLKNVDAQLQEKVMLNLKFGDFLFRESETPILDAEKFTDYCKQYIQFAKKIEAKTQDQDSDAFPHEKTEEVGADETNTDGNIVLSEEIKVLHSKGERLDEDYGGWTGILEAEEEDMEDAAEDSEHNLIEIGLHEITEKAISDFYAFSFSDDEF